MTNAGGEGPWSDVLQFHVPENAPKGFSALPGRERVTLVWTDPEQSGIAKWQCRQKTTGGYGSWADIPGSGPSTTSHTVRNLTNDTTYKSQNRAFAAEPWPESEEKSATPKAKTLFSVL